MTMGFLAPMVMALICGSLMKIEVRHHLEIEDGAGPHVGAPHGGHLLGPEADGVAHHDLAQAPLVAQVRQPLHHGVEQRDRMGGRRWPPCRPGCS